MNVFENVILTTLKVKAVPFLNKGTAFTKEERTGSAWTRRPVATSGTHPWGYQLNKAFEQYSMRTTNLFGTTEKDATVQVYNGKTLIGEAKPNSKGKLTVKIEAQNAGTSLTVEAKDKAGNKIESTVIKVA
ncbi:Ig-like domain-containing protein [Lysinibacillus xylanilyticus]|uniref:Ig-like domain-containing protein n=1 Tax=Lysinibacillus xylanilyticus TaxID=582475 RepID=UPI0038159173